jgi:ribonuclease HIII
LEITSPNEKKYHFEVTVAELQSEVKILVYFGKNGVKTILQGRETSSLYRIITDEIFSQEKLFEEKPIEIANSYIGTDESGKGDFFGPIVVAGFFTTPEISKQLQEIGVKDSKLLSDLQIQQIRRIIDEAFPENYQYNILLPAEYNVEYSKVKNINKILIELHSNVANKLIEKFNSNFVITDKFSKRNLELKRENVTTIQETKAEKYIAVAAASIIARSEVVIWFENLKNKGIELPKGGGNETTKTAQNLANKYGKQNLARICKLHFKNYLKIV